MQNTYICNGRIRTALMNHKRTHTRPFVCDFQGCDKAFATKGNLVSHKRTHSDHNPFVCDFQGCGKAFANHGTLTNHKRTHSDHKPFVCDVRGCGKAFTFHRDLTRHHRIHTGQRPFVCDVEGCGKNFTRGSTLTLHKRTHTGNKPFVCYCDENFAKRSDLTRHYRIHTQKFVCDVCIKAYTTSDHLDRHRKKAHSLIVCIEKIFKKWPLLTKEEFGCLVKSMKDVLGEQHYRKLLLSFAPESIGIDDFLSQIRIDFSISDFDLNDIFDE